MTTRIYAHNQGSQGARALGLAMGVRVLRSTGSTWRPRPGDRIINWGSSHAIPFAVPNVLNRPEVVALTSNKLHFFRDQPQELLPEWTADQLVAREWVAAGITTVARTILNGHSGAGIHILENGVDFVVAPLYTKYVKKTAEYRIHIVRGRSPDGETRMEVIDAQRKIRDPDREPTNWKVRSHDNGFIYVRDGVEIPTACRTNAISAMGGSGLDFGAVDVIWNQRQEQAYVLEINTAPGLTGQTVTSYAEAFRNVV